MKILFSSEINTLPINFGFYSGYYWYVCINTASKDKMSQCENAERGIIKFIEFQFICLVVLGKLYCHGLLRLFSEEEAVKSKRT